MKKIRTLIELFLLLLLFSCVTRDNPALYRGVKIMAYYFPSRGNSSPGDLPLHKLSHIFFAFTEVIDNEMKFRRDSSGIQLKLLVNQKLYHPDLKVMISCGGWGGSGGFSEMARSPENREKFTESAVSFINYYDLDGLDIDWEYPTLRQGRLEDKARFAMLVKVNYLFFGEAHGL